MKTSVYWLSFVITALVISLLISCEKEEKPSIAVYKVTKSGTDRETAEKLLKLMSVDETLLENGNFIDVNGRVAIIDKERHFSMPTKILGNEGNDEDDQVVVAEALDFERLETLNTLSPKEAQDNFVGSLEKAGLLPDEGAARARNNWLTVVDDEGNVVSNKAINTRVFFDIRVGDFPVEGPGAKVNASYLGDGMITQLKYANRSLAKGEMVTLLDENKIKEQCKKLYNQSAPNGKYQDLEIKTRLFYYSPPLSYKEVHTIIPYYECTGIATTGDRKIALMQRTVPAIDDEKYVPTVSLEISIKGSEVTANAKIEGGSPPYHIQWSSPSVGSREGETELNYQFLRRAEEMHEVLSLEVTDNNGVYIQTSQLIKVDQAAVIEPLEFSGIRQGGVRDYGTENSVYNEFGALEQGFKDQMNGDGVTRRFSWRGLAAWEQDFKSPEDSKWIDNTDITFYVGHGNVGFFTFEDSTHDDSWLDNDDATGDWGDKDLEWLALYSCQVMGKGGDGQEPFRNWKQEFDGLHLLLGFHTNAAVSSQFSGKFASNMLSSNMTVLQAWFDAIDDHQPNDREGVVMGVFRAGDYVWNFNDHFHGKGTVGPDIRGSNIGLGWYITGP